MTGTKVVPLDTIEDRKQFAEKINGFYSKVVCQPQDLFQIPRTEGGNDLYFINKNKLLGIGSYGQIYKAYRLSPEGEVYGEESQHPPIAVKFVPMEQGVTVSDNSAYKTAVIGLNREERALKKLGKLSHRVRTNVEEYGEAAGNYLFMPLYPGEKFGKLRESKQEANGSSGALPGKELEPLEEKFDLMRQLGEQVELLHDQHLIHGDIHPSNFLATRDLDNRVQLQLIDFDQSRTFEQANQLVEPFDAINMALPIRAPEVARKQIGAPSDIYSLGLNFLFMLGHPDPFMPTPSKEFRDDLTEDYVKKNSEYSSSMATFKNKSEYKELASVQEKQSALEKYSKKLIRENVTDAYIESQWFEKTKRTDIGKLEMIPSEIGGISARLATKYFIENMLSDDIKRRPLIGKVNQFMRGMQLLIKEKEHVSANDPDVLYVKEVAKIAHQEQLDYKAKVDHLIAGMKNMGLRIDALKKSGSSFKLFDKAKSQNRVQFEQKVTELASVHETKSSGDFKRDYQKLVEALNKEKKSLDEARTKFLTSHKLSALENLLEEAEQKKSPDELKPSMSHVRQSSPSR